MELTLDVNWVAVVVAAVANMALGFVWYQPKVFGQRWAAASGRSLTELQAGGNSAYVVTALMALISSYVLAQFLNVTSTQNAYEGALIGVIGWAGFTATASTVDHLFSGRSRELWSIQNGYQLVGFTLMGAILGYLM